MRKSIKKLKIVGDGERTLGELIHVEVRTCIERAVREELDAVLGQRYARLDVEVRTGLRCSPKLTHLCSPKFTQVRIRDLDPGSGSSRKQHSPV